MRAINIGDEAFVIWSDEKARLRGKGSAIVGYAKVRVESIERDQDLYDVIVVGSDRIPRGARSRYRRGQLYATRDERCWFIKFVRFIGGRGPWPGKRPET